MGPKCCFCQKMLPAQAGISERFWGNNPEPLKHDDVNRCCDDCNDSLVIPARIEKYG